MIVCKAEPTTKDGNKADPIIGHPDVKRMLLNISSINEAGRAFSVYVGHLLDQAKFAQGCQELRPELIC